MITTGQIKELESGVFSLILDPCSALVLPHILADDVPYVYIEAHWPNPRYESWTAPVPLERGGQLHELQVRRVEFDISLATSQFIALLPEFADAGLTLMQFKRAIPNSL